MLLDNLRTIGNTSNRAILLTPEPLSGPSKKCEVLIASSGWRMSFTEVGMTFGSAHKCKSFLACALFACLAAAFPFSAYADTATRAARLTFIQGNVTVNQSDGSSVPGELNLPLLSGVQVVTAGDGEAEVEFEDGSVARLTPNSALSLDNLSVQPGGVFVTNLSLLRGLAYFELRAAPQYQYSVMAGDDMLSPEENSTIRVNFDQPPPSFAVLDGTARIERLNGPNGAASFQSDVRAGESLSDDPNDPARYFLTQEIAGDSWDQWNVDMDQQAAAQSADGTDVRNNYAGAQGYGWSDLDADGSWYDVPGTGPVWQPVDAYDDPGFDPYGNGAWVWYPGAGYLWASNYSWGWTPYRCGNWGFYSGFGWGWAPGAGCGGFGWGFAGGGRPVNIVSYPVGYRPTRIPVPIGVGRPLKPVLPVHLLNGTQAPKPVGRPSGVRQIAGVTASPIPRTQGAARGTNSALDRDFPVDSKTKAPVLGLASTSPTAVRTTSGFRSSNAGASTSQPEGAARSQPAIGYSAPAAAAQPTARQNGGQRPQPAATQPQPTYQRRLQPEPSVQRTAPQPQPAPRYEAPRSYSPPPASRPSYSPPPPPASHPAPSAPAPAPSRSSPK